MEPDERGHVFQFDLAEVKTPKYNFALRFSGWIEVTRKGEYTFYTISNDGSQWFINNRLVVDNDGEHGATEQSGKVTLAPGRYPIVVTYFQSGGTTALKVLYEGPGTEKQPVPATILWQNN